MLFLQVPTHVYYVMYVCILTHLLLLCGPMPFLKHKCLMAVVTFICDCQSNLLMIQSRDVFILG